MEKKRKTKILTYRTYTYMEKLKKRDNKYRRRLFIAYFLTVYIFIFDINVVKISGLSFKESVDCSVAMMIITSVLMIFLIRFKESEKLSYGGTDYINKIIAKIMKHSDEPPFKYLERKEKKHATKSVIVWALLMLCFVWVLSTKGNVALPKIIELVLFAGIPTFFLFKHLA